ncbi:MAG: glycosyltransferase family 4 protein [Alphaproteobacteria bacterium]
MRTLALFSELYSSLGKGERYGLLVRNMAQYHKFIETGGFSKIYFFTYDAGDHEILERLRSEGKVPREFHLLAPPRWLKGRLGAIVYSLIGPLLHRRTLSQVDALKTFQVSGSWTALIAKFLFGKPLLFRVGYPLSVRFKTEGKRIKNAIAVAVESLLVRNADHVAVTSVSMKDYYSRHTGKKKVTFLPSYVDVSGFTPIATYNPNRPLLFVGRLSDVKNVANLVRACGRIDMPLYIYGSGPLEKELDALAASCGADVSLKGVVSNTELMRVHHDHSFYILCSTREGMPKALIEAMASGLICISTRTDGALELIEDGRTGYLIDGFDEEAIARKLTEVRDTFDPEVGRRASAFVRKNNSLEHAVELELAIFDAICAPDKQTGRRVAPVSSPR